MRIGQNGEVWQKCCPVGPLLVLFIGCDVDEMARSMNSHKSYHPFDVLGGRKVEEEFRFDFFLFSKLFRFQCQDTSPLLHYREKSLGSVPASIFLFWVLVCWECCIKVVITIMLLYFQLIV